MGYHHRRIVHHPECHSLEYQWTDHQKDRIPVIRRRLHFQSRLRLLLSRILVYKQSKARKQITGGYQTGQMDSFLLLLGQKHKRCLLLRANSSPSRWLGLYRVPSPFVGRVVFMVDIQRGIAAVVHQPSCRGLGGHRSDSRISAHIPYGFCCSTTSCRRSDWRFRVCNSVVTQNNDRQSGGQHISCRTVSIRGEYRLFGDLCPDAPHPERVSFARWMDRDIF